jgi:hypothetical protein
MRSNSNFKEGLTTSVDIEGYSTSTTSSNSMKKNVFMGAAMLIFIATVAYAGASYYNADANMMSLGSISGLNQLDVDPSEFSAAIADTELLNELVK